MNVSFQQPPRPSRLPALPEPQTITRVLERSDRLSNGARPGRSDPTTQQWMVDLTALARCRILLARHGSAESMQALDQRASQHALMDVPVAYDLFCRAHFASVRRMHPELTWDDACPAYAIALAAHAVLCVALNDEREQLLEDNWPRIRGDSNIDWSQARLLIADGCSALDRLDPLAMHR